MSYTRGDVNHNVQPVVGWLRLALEDGKSLTEDQMRSAVDKLMAACKAENELLAQKRNRERGVW